MNRNVKHILLTAGLSALFGSLTVSAQNQKELARIPFSFKAADRSMPAGEYTLEATGSNGLFRMSDESGHAVFVLTVPQNRTNASNPKLTFLCAGQQRVLAQIWAPDGTQYGITESSLEKDLSRKIEMASLSSVLMRPR